MDDPMAGAALPGPPQPIRAPIRAPGYPAATPADHGAHQMQAGVAAQPVHAAAAPAAGDAQTDEAKRSTVDAAVPVFMRDFPDFCEADCRAALDKCYRVDITIQMLIEAAFEHLVAKLTGARQEEQPPDPQQPQQNAAAAPDPNDEEEAFRQETMQMRQAMHMSEVDNAAHRKNHEKPMYQWAAQDFQDHFPRSAILPEIAKHCKGAGIDSMCTKESSCELEKLLKNEQHSQRWYKTERGLHGYWMTYATEIVRVASGLITIEAPSKKQGATHTPQKGCRTPNRKRRLQCIAQTAAPAAPCPQPGPKNASAAAQAAPQPKKSKTSSLPADSVKQRSGCKSSQRSSRSQSRSRSVTTAAPAACASMHASGSHTNNKEQPTDKRSTKASARPPHETQGAGNGNGDANAPRSMPAECASPPSASAADAWAAANPTRRSKRICARTDSVQPSREASEQPGAAAAAAAAAPLSRGSTPRLGEAPGDRGSQGGGGGLPLGGVASLYTTAAVGGGAGGLSFDAVGHKPCSTSQQGRDLKGSERSQCRDTAARTGGGGGNENGRHHQSSDGAAEQQQARNNGAAKADEHRTQHAETQGGAPCHVRKMQDQGTAENAGSARDGESGAKSRHVVIAKLVEELKRLNRRFEKEVIAVAAGPENLAAFVPFRPAGASEEEWGGVKVRRSKEGAVQIEIDD